MQHIGDGVLDVLVWILSRDDGTEDAGDAECVVEALQEQPDDRVELLGRKRRGPQPGVDPGNDLLPGPRRDRGQERVALIGVEDRFVAGVNLGVAGDPRPAARPSLRGQG